MQLSSSSPETVERDPVRVGVVGASGYSGLELVRLLLGHPTFDLSYVAANTAAEQPLATLYPQLTGQTDLFLEKFDVEACCAACDAVFVALPSGHAGQIVGALHAKGMKVVDLSGDLRLPSHVYETWYGQSAVPAALQEMAVYGLTEWTRSSVADATVVANPGCYATAALLALLPAVQRELAVAGMPIAIDAKSGVSGAGRTPTQGVHLAELSGNFYPYKVGTHQHTPEIEQALAAYGVHPVLLTTQLLPIARGIAVSAYVPLAARISEAKVREVYNDVYENAEFVHVLAAGDYPQLKHVQGSNHCHIGLRVDTRTGLLQVFSVLDNLQKGAAGQALQNMNVMFGRPETTGLRSIGLYP